MEKTFIRIKNFRSFDDVQLEIKPLTFLFGLNGAGKSSFIQAIKFLFNNLFSIWDELLEGAPESSKRYYLLDEYSNLISFNEIVTNNNCSKEIEFELNLVNTNINFNQYKKVLDQIVLTKVNNKRLVECLREVLVEFKTFNADFSGYVEEENVRALNASSVNRNISIKVIFSNYKNSRFLNLNLTISDLDNNISYNFYPNSFDDENGFTYQKEILAEDPFLEEILNDCLLFESIMPFVNNDEASVNHSLTFFIQRIDKFFSHKDNINKFDMLNNLELKNLIITLFQYYIQTFYEIPDYVKNKFSSYVHLPSLREKPQFIYPLVEGIFESDAYYGLLREFDHSDNLKGIPIRIGIFDIDDNFVPISENSSLPTHSIPEFINHMVKSFKLADWIDVEKEKLAGYLKYKSYNADSITNLANASSGLLQLLPIIAISFFNRNIDDGDNYKYRLIEQPELHLHPKLQALLADFFCLKELKERKFIIETHSEHLVRKIQVLIARGDKEKEHENLRDRVIVYFFSKNDRTGLTSVREMKIDENGLMETKWPDGFFDDKIELTFELLEAIKNRSN